MKNKPLCSGGDKKSLDFFPPRISRGIHNVSPMCQVTLNFAIYGLFFWIPFFSRENKEAYIFFLGGFDF